MAAKRRHKGRELSRSKRKKEGHRQVATPQALPVASATPQPAAPEAAVPLEAAPPVTRPAPVAGGAVSLMAELKRAGLFALIALAILVVLALTLD
jgi:hypothetical protein